MAVGVELVAIHLHHDLPLCPNEINEVLVLEDGLDLDVETKKSRKHRVVRQASCKQLFAATQGMRSTDNRRDRDRNLLPLS